MYSSPEILYNTHAILNLFTAKLILYSRSHVTCDRCNYVRMLHVSPLIGPEKVKRIPGWPAEVTQGHQVWHHSYISVPGWLRAHLILLFSR